MLKQKESTIFSYTKIVNTLQDSIKNVVTADSIKIEAMTNNTLGIRTFSVSREPFFIEGNFMKGDPWLIDFNKIKANIALEIVAVENKNGTWETFVSTSKGVTVVELDTRHRPYKKTIIENIKLGIGATASNSYLNGFGAVSFDKYMLMLGYGTKGFNIGTVYFIK